jgi:ribosomal protein S19E (S16A)
METVKRVAEFLDVSADWLLYGKSENRGSAPERTTNRSANTTADRVQQLKRELAEAYSELTGDAVEDVRIAVTTVFNGSK